MILAVDIGNTTITIGIFRRKKLILKSSLAAQKYRKFKTFLEENLKKSHNALSAIECAVICSVVPGVTPTIEKAIGSKGNIPVYVLGKNLKVPIKNLYAKPKQVGQDRLLCAYMAMKLYGAPVISIDLGTALTFDVVSKNKEYLGGIIFPGLTLSLAVLHRYTALLPEVELKQSKALIGKNAQGSMLSGITYGYGSLIDGLVEKLKKEIHGKPKIIATGGDSLFVKRYCASIDFFEPGLIFKGMAELFEETAYDTR